MQVVKPTSVKFPEELETELLKFADKKEGGNVSRVVRKAVAKYIKFNPVKPGVVTKKSF